MNEQPLYNQLIQKLIEDRPDLAPYTELFTPQSNNNKAPMPDATSMEAKLQKMSVSLRQLRDDLDEALDFNDDLAKALGACEECWGKDNRCPSCRGRGKAGYFAPDKTLFDTYILPALNAADWLEVRPKKG